MRMLHDSCEYPAPLPPCSMIQANTPPPLHDSCMTHGTPPRQTFHFVTGQCVPYNVEYEQHDLEGKIRERYGKAWEMRFLCLREQTRGAAETLLKALEVLETDGELGGFVALLSRSTDRFHPHLLCWDAVREVVCR